MAAFRFRAQAARDLRRRQYEDAQRQVAEAEHDRSVAERRLHRATDAVSEAQRAAAGAQTRGVPAHELDWYRSWIDRLVHERHAHTVILNACTRRAADATAACHHARQRWEALERFYEKAKRAHEAAESAAERKLIDELATRRYAAVRAVET
jgi:flagellar export protein FliJ